MASVQAQATAALVKEVAQSSGVSEENVAAVLKSLGLDEVTSRIATTFSTNFDASKLGGTQISVRYEKATVTK